MFRRSDRRVDVRRPSRSMLVVLLLAQLASAYALRWPLTRSTLRTNYEYLLGQVVIASENWRREGAAVRHFIPSRSIDQRLPEWSYRDVYWRDYLSQPPLSFMLHYWASRVLDAVEPAIVGKLLAQALIAAGVLVSGVWLYAVFGFAPTLAGLTFLIWGQPFLVWFVDGFYSTTPAMVFQLTLVAWCLALYSRELAAPGDPAPWRRRRLDLMIVALLAYLGAFSEWFALFGNAVAVLAFAVLGAVFQRARSRRGRNAYAIAVALAIGSVAAEATTVLLYGTKIGFLFYWNGFLDRVNERTSGAAFWPYTWTLIRQMSTAWPPAMLGVLLVMALLAGAYAAAALALNRGRFRREDGARIVLGTVLGFGGAVAYCYRLRNLVEIHWWFSGTWTIGWSMTVCAFTYAAGRVFQRIRIGRWAAGGEAVACGILCVGAVGWNLRFVDLRVPQGHPSHDIYRALGTALPRDGFPMAVVDLPELFGDYPFTTAYLRRPVIRYDPTGDPMDFSGLLSKMGTTEDATTDLLERGGAAHGVVYIAYDQSRRQCAFDDVYVAPPYEVVPLAVCRVSTQTLLDGPRGVWTTTISTHVVEVGERGGAFAVTVSAPAARSWWAAGDGAFVARTSPVPITGAGRATFDVRPNPGSTRNSTVTVAGESVRLTQAGAKGFERCVADIEVQVTWRETGVRNAEGGVHAPPGCVWAFTSTAPWIALPKGSGAGDVRFRYSIAPNRRHSPRSGHVAVEGKAVTIVEDGCSYAVPATAMELPAGGGTRASPVTGSCDWPWTAVSDDAFITVVSGASGAGVGLVSFTAAPNTGAPRTGTLKIAGYTLIIAQAGS